MFLIAMFFSLLVCDIRIIKTPIFSFWPYINQHHIVLLDDYAIDFMPAENNTTWKLILGKNVKGEVRLRHITDKMRKYSEPESRALSISRYHSIKNRKIKNIVKKLFEWENPLNLYTHNCQHFSSYAKKLVGS